MFRSILVAVDGSAHAQRALREAVDLAVAEGATLTLITVHQPIAYYYGGWMAFDAGPAEEAARAASQAILDHAAASVPATVRSTTVLREGYPSDLLVEELHHGGHDLCVVGSRGRGAMRSLVMGSVSHHVLHHSPVPVLVVREAAASSEEPAPQAPAVAAGSR